MDREPGGLQSMGLQRVKHGCVTNTHTHTHTHTHTRKQRGKRKNISQNNLVVMNPNRSVAISKIIDHIKSRIWQYIVCIPHN